MLRRSAPPIFARRLDGARLALPAGGAATLGSHAALSTDVTGCVLVVRPDEWKEAFAGLLESSARSRHAAELARFLAAGETAVPVDPRGRLTIPPVHMEWAGLKPDGEVLVLSLGHGIQVWDPRRLDTLLRVANRQLRRLKSDIFRDQLALIGDEAS